MIFVNEEEYKSLSGIYQIRNLTNGMIYIGQTRNGFQKRYWLHQWKLRNGSHDNYFLQADWNNFNECDFIFEVVEVINDESLINTKEMQYIDDCRQTGFCYNISDGGDGKRGVPMSAEAKKIVGEKNRLHNTGKHASDITKSKMSASRKGKKRDPAVMEALRQTRIGSHHSEETKRKMRESKLVAYKSGAMKTVLNEDVVRQIKKMLMCGVSKSEVSKLLGIAYHNVKSVASGVAWSHVSVEDWNE